jgi:hypothetical protein
MGGGKMAVCNNVRAGRFAVRQLPRFALLAACCLLILSACDRGEPVDLKCGDHTVAGKILRGRAELAIDGIRRIMPLQMMFTDEPAAKYAPQYLSSPSFAMTITDYVALMPDESKADFAVYSRGGKTEYYELEIEGDKWLCR